MRQRVLLVVALLLPLFAVAIAWAYLPEPGVRARTVRVERGAIQASITVTGTVISEQEVKLTSSMLGRIKHIAAEEGAIVRRGEVLAQLDDAETLALENKAQAVLARDAQAVAEAERRLARLRSVLASGGASSQTVDDAEAEWRAAVARERVSRADLRLAQVNVDKTKITAPFDAIVTSKVAQVGQWVEPAEALFMLSALDTRVIEAKVDAGDSALVAAGQAVRVSCDAFPGRAWQESIVWIAPAVNAAKEELANTFDVRISLGAQAPALLLRQQVDVKIQTASQAQALKVPFGAVMERDGQTLAATVRDNTVHLLPITTGIEDLTYVEIVAGLAEGDRVILTQGKALKEGDAVSSSIDEAK